MKPRFKAMLAAVFLLAGCGQTNALAPKEVTMMNADGDKVGKATFSQAAKGVKIHLEVQGLTTGPHGLHIHEFGSCESPDFTSAGNHFNPDKKDHGLMNAKGAHAGDLPNIEADADGRAVVDLEATNVTLEEGKKNSLVGRNGTALIIQEREDDGMSQPAGDSGKRVACGIIQKKKEPKPPES
ncbi:superoxide dismutase family protein [Bacillaceae bacterium SIJ1]|uniref:superoxide dismutase family protein n=1 Tax=Litoribacterium kuwaitense TaxID=1398745 RepID=UPI0013EAC636|nr:superoxide dismutase family protein [Litoribacterium kuwaitense]NGP46618.1 superoxide dismutase family protein [Litoribacterium kuwaitense]